MFQMGLAVVTAAAMLGGGSGLPKGLLFMESHPPAKAWETYRTSDSTKRQIQLNPCFRKKAWDTGRIAARTVTYSSEDRMKYEQFVVYKNVRQAKQAMRGLRAELARCADVGKGYHRYRYFTKPVAVGDEGLRAGGLFFENGEHAVAVRRGAAVYVVGESAVPTRSLPIRKFRGLIAQAEKMTVKVCRLPRAAC
ncbi:hypothetical protein [Nonomuraea cavernae]|uniref:Uncharacterized protein n=1 Tax=Nonomuraea cavernae TaxID=2045107 RepID=A0A918DHK7_9ACTN|nr:hypothetical protein [Nonomuraea cavernae]MCA2184814.1 hypothetical protein [Nonomuraea cavernae]GGO64541.1 hypothetical protein GCM10012289_14110 [Nonomuraea cavernae]